MDRRLFELWGKTTEDERYHPAIYHMLDVAHASRVLMSKGGSARVRATLEYAWQGANISALFAWLPFLVALHDIGKISAPFQAQESTPEAKRQVQRLRDLGVQFPTLSASIRLPHSIISTLFIIDHLGKLESGIDSDFKRIIADAASGHHGVFDGNLRRIRSELSNLDELSYWHPMRLEGYQYLRQVLAPKDIPLAAIGTPTRLRPATIALTGLIILSDWLGSNTNFFPADCSTPPEQYCENSLSLAFDAVRNIGFDAPRQTPEDTNCEALFKPLEPPEKRDYYQSRPLQVAIDQLTPEQLQTPSLYVIEAPTGEGKTEAGLTLARRLAAHGASDEVFFALPTMATSNQMYKRTSRLFQALYGERGLVKLAHGQAALVQEELERASQLDAVYTDTNDYSDNSSGEYSLAWFSSSKRALLAPFGTGTVDQVELGGLNTRYYMLRLFGLAGKTVIIDEVHAYDTYMNTILDHTLRWLAALGSNVILLSATLPAQRHAQLAQAFQQGCDRNISNEELETVDAYPVIAHYHHTQQTVIPVSAYRSAQTLTIQWVHDRDYAAQAQRLLDLTANGGAVARICNRVADAQHIFIALQKAQPDARLVLIHARMPLNQRTEREHIVEQFVGKNTTRTQQERIIIVGTQVLEQSLDYDVDVMVSDLAPIDLLLQRAGRLHRHQRERTLQHNQPILYVQHTWETPTIPAIERWQMIYEPFVLYRTWQILQQRSNQQQITITLPRDYRTLIEAVYAPYQPNETDGDLSDVLENTQQQAQDKAALMEQQAQTRLIPSVLFDESAMTEGAYDVFVADEDGGMQGWDVAKTRLGDRITTIPMYCQPDGSYSLDPHGNIALPQDKKAKLDVELTKTMLEHSLPISSPEWLMNKLRKEEWSWKAVPVALKYLYPLYLQPDGTAMIAKIRLDPVLGLVIDSEVV